MTTSPDDFVSATVIKTKSDITGNDIQYYNGLSKREYFAAQALTALTEYGSSPSAINEKARVAVRQADVLIAELNKPITDGN